MDIKKVYKNPVGRPKKRYNQDFKSSIVLSDFNNSTNNTNNIVSFSNKNLLLFKQIINLFKLLELNEFYITFTPTSMKFFIIDDRTTNVVVDIDVNQLADYNFNYSGASGANGASANTCITISCMTVKMNDIFTNINSSYDIALFSITNEYNLKIELINLNFSEHNISYLPVEVINVSVDDLDIKLKQAMSLNNFVSFELPVKLLKKKLSNHSKQCKYFNIKIEKASVTFQFNPQDKYGTHLTQYTDMEKICYKNSNSIELELVINIDNVLSFSNLSLSENIQFFIIAPPLTSVAPAIKGTEVFCKAVLDPTHTVVIKIPTLMS